MQAKTEQVLQAVIAELKVLELFAGDVLSSDDLSPVNIRRMRVLQARLKANIGLLVELDNDKSAFMK